MISEPVYRILDAAADRGREAVRVIEDAIRFLADDAVMTEKLKEFRHQYAAMTDRLPWPKRLSARCTDGDVGTQIEGSGEYRRESLDRILSANFCRLQESLRSLEEYSKLALPEMARLAEQLRYESYTLHKDVVFRLAEGGDRLLALRKTRLYLLIDTALSDENLKCAAAAGADIFQFRDKTASDRLLYETGKRFKTILDTLFQQGQIASRPLFIVNDRTDMALAVGADGVHIGQSELPPEEVRRLIGPGMILGLSTSNPEEADNALSQISGSARVDYLGAGPVFPSKTKKFESFAGLEYLRYLAQVPGLTIPIYPIGGINLTNISQVVETGFHRICVANAVTGQPDMGRAVHDLLAALSQ